MGQQPLPVGISQGAIDEGRAELGQPAHERAFTNAPRTPVLEVGCRRRATLFDLDPEIARPVAGRSTMGQGGAQLGATPVNAAANGAELHVQHRGDLLVSETLDVAQHDRRPEFRRQGRQGGGHVVVQSGVGQLLRRGGPATRQPLRRAVGQTVEADLLLAAGRVQEQVGGDPVQPALERAGLEAVQERKTRTNTSWVRSSASCGLPVSR